MESGKSGKQERDGVWKSEGALNSGNRILGTPASGGVWWETHRLNLNSDPTPTAKQDFYFHSSKPIVVLFEHVIIVDGVQCDIDVYNEY